MPDNPTALKAVTKLQFDAEKTIQFALDANEQWQITQPFDAKADATALNDFHAYWTRFNSKWPSNRQRGFEHPDPTPATARSVTDAHAAVPENSRRTQARHVHPI